MMKRINFLTIAIVAVVTLGFISCSNDDDTPPAPVNEEEVITSVIVTLTGEGDVVELESRDLDGDGPNDPVVSVNGTFQENIPYVGSVQFLNETESPAEDINEEILEEAEEHQVFFVFGGGLDGSVTYGDEDSNGNPIGLQFTLLPESASSGTLTVVLRHEPTKPNDGTLGDAGGETDVSATFQVTIE